MINVRVTSPVVAEVYVLADEPRIKGVHVRLLDGAVNVMTTRVLAGFRVILHSELTGDPLGEVAIDLGAEGVEWYRGAVVERYSVSVFFWSMDEPVSVYQAPRVREAAEADREAGRES